MYSPLGSGLCYQIWRTHEELRWLAKALPPTALKFKGGVTLMKYLGTFQRWKTLAEARRGVQSFLVQEIHLVLYMQHLSESIQSKSAVEEAVHVVSGLPSIAGSLYCRGRYRGGVQDSRVSGHPPLEPLMNIISPHRAHINAITCIVPYALKRFRHPIYH